MKIECESFIFWSNCQILSLIAWFQYFNEVKWRWLVFGATHFFGMQMNGIEALNCLRIRYTFVEEIRRFLLVVQDRPSS